MATDRRRFLALLAIGAPATVVGKRLASLARLKSYFFAPCGGSRAAESTPKGSVALELDELLKDPTISDILVNGCDKVHVVRAGKLEPTDLRFDDDRQLIEFINRIVSQVGQRLDKSSPTVEARLPDGSRVSAIIRPVAVDGPCLYIRPGRDPVTAGKTT